MRGLISILMPTYNVESYVEYAIRSILNQTYKNFELIIVDDCSTDNTYSIEKELAKTDSRIKLYRNEKNSKICKTLNRAWSMASGEYIARMDGDDISVPNRLEVMLAYLENNPKCDLVGSQTISIDEQGNEFSRRQYLKNGDNIKKYMKYQPTILHIWIARRIVYEKLDGYREIPYAEDYDFLLRGIREGFEYANVSDYLYKVRIRSGNTVSTNGLEQRKTADFVRKIDSTFSGTRYTDEEIAPKLSAAIRASQKEKRHYTASANELNKAIKNKENRPYMIFHAVCACLLSAETSKYLLQIFLIRKAIKQENKCLH